MTGEAALVVQEPLEEIWQVARSCSFTPTRTVLPSFVSLSIAGAVITTRLAPAARCTLAFSYDSNAPVASTTISTPNFPQGSNEGSFSWKTATFFSPTNKEPDCAFTSFSNLPYTVSY